MTHEGFRRVEREEFYKAVGPLNIHPYPQGRWSDSIGYLCHWKTPAGEVLALSDGGDSCKIHSRYWLRESRFPAPKMSSTTVDVSVIKEYGLTQKLSNSIRVY